MPTPHTPVLMWEMHRGTSDHLSCFLVPVDVDRYDVLVTKRNENVLDPEQCSTLEQALGFAAFMARELTGLDRREATQRTPRRHQTTGLNRHHCHECFRESRYGRTAA